MADRIDRLIRKLFFDPEVNKEINKSNKKADNTERLNSVKAWINEHGNVLIQGYYYGRLVNVLIPFEDLDNYLFYVHGHAEKLLRKHGYKLLKLKEGLKEVQLYP